MSTTITIAASTIMPTLVLGYQTETETQNVTHVLLNSASRAVTLGAESLRSGELQLFFSTESAAWAARTVMKTVGVFTLASTDIAAIGMKFVREGSMRIALDEATREQWVLYVSYREVAA